MLWPALGQPRGVARFPQVSADLRALAYGASSDLVQVAASTTLDNLSTLTVAVLARVRTQTNARYFIGKDTAAAAGWFLRLNATAGVDARWLRTSNTTYSWNNTVALNTWRWYILTGDRAGGTALKWRLYSSDWDDLARPITATTATEGSGSPSTDAGRPLSLGNTGAVGPNLALPGDIALVALWNGQATLAQIHRFQRTLSPDAIRQLTLLGYWLPGHDGQSGVRDYGPGQLHATTITGAAATSGGLPGFWGLPIVGKAGGAASYLVTLSGGLTPAGDLVRQTTKLVAGGITPTGALAVLKVVIKTLAGGLTPAGALVRQITKPLGGGMTPTGALLKTTTKPLAGGLTPTGTLAALKVVIRSMSGGLTPAGALVRQTTKALLAGITPAGALSKRATKLLTGALTPVGALTKRLGKSFAGALTPVGALLAQIVSGGGPVLMQLVAGVRVSAHVAAGTALRLALDAAARLKTRLSSSTDIGPEA